jgi:hypothetical protein
MARGPPGDSDVQHALPVTFDTEEDLGYPCRDSETAGCTTRPPRLDATGRRRAVFSALMAVWLTSSPWFFTNAGFPNF